MLLLVESVSLDVGGKGPMEVFPLQLLPEGCAVSSGHPPASWRFSCGLRGTAGCQDVSKREFHCGCI